MFRWFNEKNLPDLQIFCQQYVGDPFYNLLFRRRTMLLTCAPHLPENNSCKLMPPLLVPRLIKERPLRPYFSPGFLSTPQQERGGGEKQRRAGSLPFHGRRKTNFCILNELDFPEEIKSFGVEVVLFVIKAQPSDRWRRQFAVFFTKMAKSPFATPFPKRPSYRTHSSYYLL